MNQLRKFRRLLEDVEPYGAIERFPNGSYIERFSNGSIQYYDKDDNFHREGGPAVISIDGNRKSETWYKHGREHRTDGPSYINYHEEVVMYSVNGKRMTRREYLKHFDDNTKFKNWEVYGDFYSGVRDHYEESV